MSLQLVSVNTETKTARTTSRIIAREFTTAKGNRMSHKHLLAKIDALVAELPEEFAGPNFRLCYYEVNGRHHKEYELTEAGCMFIIMGIQTKKANLIKVKFITAFQEAMAQIRNPSTSLDVIQMMLEKITVLERTNVEISQWAKRVEDNNQVNVNNITTLFSREATVIPFKSTATKEIVKGPANLLIHTTQAKLEYPHLEQAAQDHFPGKYHPLARLCHYLRYKGLISTPKAAQYESGKYSSRPHFTRSDMDSLV